jgi:hypothetical protein
LKFVSLSSALGTEQPPAAPLSEVVRIPQQLTFRALFFAKNPFESNVDQILQYSLEMCGQETEAIVPQIHRLPRCLSFILVANSCVSYFGARLSPKNDPMLILQLLTGPCQLIHTKVRMLDVSLRTESNPKVHANRLTGTRPIIAFVFTIPSTTAGISKKSISMGAIFKCD